MTFEKFKKDIDLALTTFIGDDSVSSAIRAFSPKLYKNIKDFIKRDGKRIRPILFLITYYGYTRKRKLSYKKLIRCALSFELLHDFLLVHDDVIDNSDLRRGKPTLHRVFNTAYKLNKKSKVGQDLSIIAGDILFSMALEALLSIDEDPQRKEQGIRAFTDMAAYTGIGEYIDVVNDLTEIGRITKKDIYLTYLMKTAKYTFEGPVLVGALFAGVKRSEKNRLSELSIMLGQAFQIQNDLLDIFLSSKETGKPVLSDLSESKRTLLVWQTYRSLRGIDKIFFKKLFEKNEKTKKDLLIIKKFIIDTGAGAFCLEKVYSFLSEANRIQSQLKMRSEYKKTLGCLIDKLSEQNKKLEDNIKLKMKNEESKQKGKS